MPQNDTEPSHSTTDVAGDGGAAGGRATGTEQDDQDEQGTRLGRIATRATELASAAPTTPIIAAVALIIVGTMPAAAQGGGGTSEICGLLKDIVNLLQILAVAAGVGGALWSGVRFNAASDSAKQAAHKRNIGKRAAMGIGAMMGLRLLGMVASYFGAAGTCGIV